MWRASLIVLAMALSIGCGSDEAETPGACSGAACATKFDDCPEDAVAVLGGGCSKVGVRADQCADGFTHENGGCAPKLPSSACPKGALALLGETECHEVAPCGELPSDATLYVDGAYVGGSSDGSRARPYTTIAPAIVAASSGATIAINDGTYNESLVIAKAITLVGRCPAKVVIRGATRTIAVRSGATIRALSVTGSGQGIAIDGEGARVEKVWIHDTAGSAIATFAPANDVIVEASLIEGSRNAGVYVEGSSVTVRRSVIRAIKTASDGRGGSGVQAQIARDGSPSHVTISGSIVEAAQTAAVLSYGSNVTIEGSLLRDVPGRADTGGCVLGQKGSAAPRPSELIVRSSVLSGCGSVGVAIAGGTLLFEGSVVRDVRPEPTEQRLGIGIDGSLGATLTVRDALIERALLMGIFAGGSNATIERSIVRDVAGQTSNGANGAGIAVVREIDAEPVATIDKTLVLRTRTVGIYASGAKLTVTGSTVRGIQTQVSDGKYGDGVEASAGYRIASGEAFGSTMSIAETLVRDAARAGIVNMASHATLARSLVKCAAIDIALGRLYAYNAAEPLEAPYTLDDGGGMACGCAATADCRATATSLEPLSLAR